MLSLTQNKTTRILIIRDKINQSKSAGLSRQVPKLLRQNIVILLSLITLLSTLPSCIALMLHFSFSFSLSLLSLHSFPSPCSPSSQHPSIIIPFLRFIQPGATIALTATAPPHVQVRSTCISQFYLFTFLYKILQQARIFFSINICIQCRVLS